MARIDLRATSHEARQAYLCDEHVLEELSTLLQRISFQSARGAAPRPNVDADHDVVDGDRHAGANVDAPVDLAYDRAEASTAREHHTHAPAKVEDEPKTYHEVESLIHVDRDLILTPRSNAVVSLWVQLIEPLRVLHTEGQADGQ